MHDASRQPQLKDVYLACEAFRNAMPRPGVDSFDYTHDFIANVSNVCLMLMSKWNVPQSTLKPQQWISRYTKPIVLQHQVEKADHNHDDDDCDDDKKVDDDDEEVDNGNKKVDGDEEVDDDKVEKAPLTLPRSLRKRCQDSVSMIDDNDDIEMATRATIKKAKSRIEDRMDRMDREEVAQQIGKTGKT